MAHNQKAKNLQEIRELERQRHAAKDDKRPSSPDPATELFDSTIRSIQEAVDYAYHSGGKCWETQIYGSGPNDDTREGLVGVSYTAYTTVILQLNSVCEMLDKLHAALKNWAFKARRMRQLKKHIMEIHDSDNAPLKTRVHLIKQRIFEDIGCIDEYYVFTFANLKENIEPTVFALSRLHDFLEEICAKLDLQIVINDPVGDTSSDFTESSESSGSEVAIKGGISAIAPPSPDLRSGHVEDDKHEDVSEQPLHESFRAYGNDMDLSRSYDGIGDNFLEQLHAAASGNPGPSSIASDKPNTSLSMPPRSSHIPSSPGQNPFISSKIAIDRPIFPPKRTTLVPEEETTQYTTLVALPVNLNLSPACRVYALSLELIIKALAQAKKIMERSEKYYELAEMMQEQWEGWEAYVIRNEVALCGEDGDSGTGTAKHQHGFDGTKEKEEKPDKPKNRFEFGYTGPMEVDSDDSMDWLEEESMKKDARKQSGFESFGA